MNILLSASLIGIFLLAVGKLAFSLPIDNTPCNNSKATTTMLKFSSDARQRYAERMTTLQPVDNDRLLDGEGKNHALEAIVKVVSVDNIAVASVLQQVGDTFS